MAVHAQDRVSTPAISFRWIIDKRSDLLYYIGSALVGWLYAGVALLAVALLDDPMRDAFAVIKLGGIHIPLTLQLLVFSSWAFLLDAPHVWSTLARTFFDPDEWRVRRREMLISLGWFLVAPTAILTPYLVGWALAPFGITLPPFTLGLGALLFTVFFRLWAYYHVVRQHWGFLILYKRKNGDMEAQSSLVDTWFFNLSLYAPLIIFLFGPLFSKTPGLPKIPFDSFTVGGIRVAGVIYPLAWAVFAGAILLYLGYQVYLWRRGQALNGPKLLFLSSLIPLHLAAFSHPYLAALMVPIVTAGHNIQYHRIVWMYGQNKYQAPEARPKFRIASALFSRFWVYFGVGLLFTFALYRGPWIDWLKTTVGMNLDQSIFMGVGMMAGLADPTTLNLGQQLFGGFLVGWAMQHYYLDSKIWRVRSDQAVAKQLQVDA
ncbi:MAG: hypothetical protein ACOY94_15875 [Bacillota bacterium]